MRDPIENEEVSVRVSGALGAAIDRWIEQDGKMLGAEGMSRPEAVRRLTVEALRNLGIMSVHDQGKP